MSGPKVVRIVTREEIIAICEGVLARLDQALADWEATGKRHDCVSGEEAQAARARRDAIAALIKTDRFAELSAQAPVEEAFLRGDRLRRLEDIAARAAVARSREIRGTQASAAILKALDSAGRPGTNDLRARLSTGQADAAAVAEALALLSEEDRATAQARTRSLADKLRDDSDPALDAQRWQKPESPTEQTISALEARLLLVEEIAPTESVASCRERIIAAAEEADPARQRLMLDGLDVETGRLITKARTLVAACEAVDAALAELETVAPGESAVWRDKADEADSDAMSALAVSISQHVDGLRAVEAAQARRTALLTALAGLGYEVSGEMETATVADGKIVLRKSDRPDYGMEIAPAGERVQIRAVAFTENGDGPDLARDRDAETIWCGDVTKLEDDLQRAGGDFRIERAHAIGATPLKRIERASHDAALRSRVGPELKTRSLD